MHSLLKPIGMTLAGLLMLTLSSCTTTSDGSFQPNPDGVMEISIDQSVIVPVGGITYVDDKGVEMRNDREFRIPYKWRIIRPR